MEQQRNTIDDLARRHLGRQLQREPQADLDILQLLLDKQLVKADDTLQLQAMGVVLGELYCEVLGVDWVVYDDERGRSRALRWKHQQELLYPITMISRRVEAGVQVSMEDIYQKGLAIMTPITQRDTSPAARRRTFGESSTSAWRLTAWAIAWRTSSRSSGGRLVPRPRNARPSSW